MTTKKLRWRAGWLHLDLARLLFLGVPLSVAYAVLMTWVPITSRPQWMLASTGALAATCLVLLWPTLRDTPKTLGGPYLACFLCFVTLITLLSDLDLLAGRRTTLEGFDEQVPSNLLGLGCLGDWHYAAASDAPAAKDLVIVMFDSFAGRSYEAVRTDLRMLLTAARINQAQGVAFDIYLEQKSDVDSLFAREVENALEQGLEVVFGYRQTRQSNWLSKMPSDSLRGHLQGFRESDGKMRLIPVEFPGANEYPALSVVVADLLRTQSLELPANRLFRFVRPVEDVEVIRIHEGNRIRPKADRWKKALTGRFVIVGSASSTDRVSTPFGKVQGVEVHAWAANSLATDSAFVDIDPRLTMPLVFVLCFVLTARHARGLGRRRVLVAAVVLSLVLVAVAVLLAAQARLWLEVSYPLLAIWLLTALLISIRGLRRRLAELWPSVFADGSLQDASTGGVGRVFLSHNSRDKPVVREIDDALAQRGLVTWFDEDRFEPGERWQSELDKALSKCSVFVVMIGRHGLGPWQALESDAAVIQHVQRGVRVIPVLLPGAPDDFAFEPVLQQFQAVDFRDGLSSEAMDRLAWVLVSSSPRT